MSINGDTPNPTREEDPVNPRDPSGFLSEIIGSAVIVKLNAGTVYKGKLEAVDGYMNITVHGCEEVRDDKVVRKWGNSFIRGNNVTYISADEDRERVNRTAVAEATAREAKAKAADA